MKKLYLIALTLLSASVFAQTTAYNVNDFGAKGDGRFINTEAINKAIEKCHIDGGGMVIIPAGTYKSGTIFLKDNIELHLEIGATLLASTEPKDFPRQPIAEYRAFRDVSGWYSLIYAVEASNIAITGWGTIDGNGALQKTRFGDIEDEDGRPRNILFISCKQIRVEGIKMRSSGMWNQHYLNCEDVFIDKIDVYNHSNRNNDAIDIDGCRRVSISNCIFDTDDDGITLKSTGSAAVEDVCITNCVVSSYCNAIKTGTESTGGFRNITISNCVVKPSRNKSPSAYNARARSGITGICLAIVDGGVMEGITINNVVIEGTECPLYIRLANRARKHIASAPEPPVGIIRNIIISNVTAYGAGNYSNSITAIPGYYIENVTIDNVRFFNKGGLKSGEYTGNVSEVMEDEKGYPQPNRWGNLPSSTLFVRHVKNLSVENLMFGSNDPDPRTPIVVSDAKNIRIGKSVFTGSTVPESFVALDKVESDEVEKPLGWGNQAVIKK